MLKLWGGELEADFLPNRHWEIQGGLGLLDTRYLSLSPDTLNDKNLNGTPILTLHSKLGEIASHIIESQWRSQVGSSRRKRSFFPH